MADALSDFVQLTSAVGNFTGSLAALYNMKTQKQTERVQAQISQKQGEFLDRMRLMPGDQNRIDEDNWRENLNAFDGEVNSAIGSINEQVVRDRVSNGLTSMNQQFHNGIANALYEKEIERAQNEALITDSTQVSRILTLDDKDYDIEESDSVTGEKKVVKHNAYKEAVALFMTGIETDEANGLFDPTSAMKRRQAVESTLYGKQYADDALAASGGGYEEAAVSVQLSGAATHIRSAAIKYLEDKEKQGEAATNARWEAVVPAMAAANDPGAFAAAMEIAEKADGNTAFKQAMYKKAIEVGVNSESLDVIGFTDKTLENQRWGDNSSLYSALHKIESMRDAIPKDVRGSKELSETYGKCVNRIRDEIDKSTGSPKEASDRALGKYDALEAAWRTKSPCRLHGYENVVSLNDLFGYLYKNTGTIDHSSWASSVDRIGKLLQSNGSQGDKELYSFYTGDGGEVIRQALLQYAKSNKDAFGSATGAVKNALGKKDDKGAFMPSGDMDSVIDSIQAEVKNVMLDASITNKPSALRDAVLKASLPYMRGYLPISTPIKTAGGGYNMKGYIEHADAGDYDSTADSTTGESLLPAAITKRKAEILALPEVNKALDSLGLKKAGYTLVENSSGDIWFGKDGGNPKVGDVRYSVDKPDAKKKEKDFGIHKYRLNKNGQWERVD